MAHEAKIGFKLHGKIRTFFFIWGEKESFMHPRENGRKTSPLILGSNTAVIFPTPPQAQPEIV